MIPLILYTNRLSNATAYIKTFCHKNSIAYKSLITVEKENTTIPIEKIRLLWTSLERAHVHRMGVVMYDFDTARKETQNALLKMLEEEQNRIQFFLVTRDISSIIPTILSRCKLIKLEYRTSDAFSQPISAIALTEFGNTDKISKEKAIMLLDRFIATLRNKMKKQITVHNNTNVFNITEVMREMLSVRQLMIKNNINPAMAIDHCIMKCFSI